MCEHKWQVASSTTPDGGGRRVVTFSCIKCKETMSKLTARSDRQIKAELEAQ